MRNWKYQLRLLRYAATVSIGQHGSPEPTTVKEYPCLLAILTHSSTESLGLQAGSDAFALIKASSVILLTDTAGIRLSTRNQLTGTVSEVVKGAVNSEVVLTLGSGTVITAIITNDSVQSLGLAAGKAATAAFKASSVIVGVKV